MNRRFFVPHIHNPIGGQRAVPLSIALFSPVLFVALLLILAPTSHADEPAYIRSPRLGITFISSPEAPADELRYQRALELGAGWDRFPIYWNHLETSAGFFDWTRLDHVVEADLNHGLSIDAILLGMPEFRRDGERIAGLHSPIFSDGTDTYREGKTINPDNYWAGFVFRVVSRYMPGGTLSHEMGWDDNVGIRVWEIWNEPDFALFWSASIGDYARLLKVAYIVAHGVDAQAQVMFGGLLFNSEEGTNYLARVLAIYEDDPFREDHNWYMDSVAVHNYNYAWRSGWLVRWVRETLRAYQLERPIWLNETGAPVWDDYPGPTWANEPDDHALRVTQEQQAWFLIQSATYAWYEGADVIFFHQLYDDCGNQPPGTDFAPDDSQFGDAFGIYRNEANALCFSQHPQPGSARPVAQSFQLLAQVFGTAPFRSVQMLSEETDDAVIISFDLGIRQVVVFWNRSLENVKVDIPSGVGTAHLVSLTLNSPLTADTASGYEIDLPAAIPDGFPFLNPGDVSGIGGPPYLLIEGQAPALTGP
ncbi:MAG: hypothetical protein U0694_02350 [Anaerolineae bacterium]